mmetsp:Transcript_60797/g.168560  ORF Transcript_60797/g.168560 Transcript_60797/m.168560 type:complete len:213 (-) Transcript_60797:1286-1924(-)
MDVLHLCIAKTGGGAGTCGENMFSTPSGFRTAKGEEYTLCCTTPGFTLLVREGDLAAKLLDAPPGCPPCGEPVSGAGAAPPMGGAGVFAAVPGWAWLWPGTPKGIGAPGGGGGGGGAGCAGGGGTGAWLVAAKDFPGTSGPTDTEAPPGGGARPGLPCVARAAGPVAPAVPKDRALAPAAPGAAGAGPEEAAGTAPRLPVVPSVDGTPEAWA